MQIQLACHVYYYYYYHYDRTMCTENANAVDLPTYQGGNVMVGPTSGNTMPARDCFVTLRNKEWRCMSR
jgi:hypothetical protein